MRLVTFLSLIGMTTLPGCLEETGLRGLPKATTNGENTIGAVVNGETIYNKYDVNVGAHWYQDDKQLQFSGTFNDGSSLQVTLKVPDRKILSYKIDGTDADSLQYSPGGTTHFRLKNQCDYTAGSYEHKTNSMTITFTRFEVSDDSGVISGTFEISLKAKDCDDLEIKQGVFDISVGDNRSGIF